MSRRDQLVEGFTHPAVAGYMGGEVAMRPGNQGIRYRLRSGTRRIPGGI